MLARTVAIPLVILLAASACATGGTMGPLVDGGTLTDASPASDAATTMSIPTLRNPAAPGHPSVGSWVTVAGAIVTGVKSAGTNHGFFIQDPTAKTWGATFVFVGPATVAVAAGDVVTVTATLTPYRGLDELDATQGTISQTGSASVPSPIDVTPNDIREGSVTAPQYQSMLLRVMKVTATTATAATDFTVVSSAGGGSDTLIVTSYMANDVGPSPFPASPGQTYSSIIGHGYKFGPTDAAAVAKLAPTSSSQVSSP